MSFGWPGRAPRGRAALAVASAACQLAAGLGSGPKAAPQAGHNARNFRPGRWPAAGPWLRVLVLRAQWGQRLPLLAPLYRPSAAAPVRSDACLPQRPHEHVQGARRRTGRAAVVAASPRAAQVSQLSSSGMQFVLVSGARLAGSGVGAVRSNAPSPCPAQGFAGFASFRSSLRPRPHPCS
jgi:hypothetical protein